MIDIKSMRQLDTGALVTLKQRIERELMRRVELDRTEAAAREQLGLREPAVSSDVGFVELSDELRQRGYIPTRHLNTDGTLVVQQAELTQRESPFELDGTGPEFIPAATNTPTSLAQRQLLREPDPGCTRCWGRGIVVVPDTHIAVTLTKLCPCLWGGV